MTVFLFWNRNATHRKEMPLTEKKCHSEKRMLLKLGDRLRRTVF